MIQKAISNILPFLFVLVAFTGLKAEVTLPKVIGSNMVLQRNKPLPVWGNAAAGEAVTVRFGKQEKKTVADASGKWQVVLDAVPASAKPARMVISGTNTITLENVLVGEVWLCSGQSNMEYTMTKSSKYADAKKSKGLGPEELKKENNPFIRLFLVKRDLNKPGDQNKGWTEAKEPFVGTFSAAGYHFAKKIYNELKIPVGIISSAIPGSRIEPWVPAEAFAASSYFTTAGNVDSLKIGGSETGKHYKGMIRPVAPFALRGFLWYQGESNCFLGETDQYTQKMHVLIDHWRTIWGDKNMPFYFVQIAPFYYSKSTGGNQAHTEETLPEFREAQAAALSIPYTGMVVTTDLVDNPEDIHPAYKWEIGRRLALWALAKDYGKKVVYSGPMFKEMKAKGNMIEITFDHTGGGLASIDKQPLTGFTIAGADGRFVAANAEIRGDKVVVSAPSVPEPKSVRFAWNEAAQPNFYNKAGLPALPFRTDGPKTNHTN